MPLLSRDFGSRSQVDLIDMQSSPQSHFKWIIVYQCHLTRFCIIRPVTSKRAAEVAFQLLDICLLFGAPAILQSDSGSEFTAQVIRELNELWPQLTMVHGDNYENMAYCIICLTYIVEMLHIDIIFNETLNYYKL